MLLFSGLSYKMQRAFPTIAPFFPKFFDDIHFDLPLQRATYRLTSPYMKLVSARILSRSLSYRVDLLMPAPDPIVSSSSSSLFPPLPAAWAALRAAMASPVLFFESRLSSSKLALLPEAPLSSVGGLLINNHLIIIKMKIVLRSSPLLPPVHFNPQM